MDANTKQTKKAAASAARERGEGRFLWLCKTHGEAEHYANPIKPQCVACVAEKTTKLLSTPEGREKSKAYSRATHAKRMANPETREAHKAYKRDLDASRKANDPAYVAHCRAKGVNMNTVKRMRAMGRPESAMPSKETLAECAEFVKHAPIGCQMDHGVPLKGIHPVTGEWIVSGLHFPYCLEPMLARSNLRKRNGFDPEAPLAFQLPYNSFPGGQFHGDHAQDEFMRYTTPTTLHLMTQAEFEAAIIEGANAEMEEFLHLQGGETAASA